MATVHADKLSIHRGHKTDELSNDANDTLSLLQTTCGDVHDLTEFVSTLIVVQSFRFLIPLAEACVSFVNLYKLLNLIRIIILKGVSLNFNSKELAHSF